jgi:formylglycine-generating enzyme
VRLALLLAGALALAGCGAREAARPAARCLADLPPAAAAPSTAGMVLIKGGEFQMGAAPLRREEGPPRTTRVRAFWMDRTEVTNAQFARFVAATGYVTLAER